MRATAFLAALAASLVLALIAIAGLPRLGLARPSAEITWTQDLYVQKTRIADAIAGPRILVVGGSGALFSFDTQLATRRLGRPVVNFGTHAGLGLRYILDRASRVLRPGDIVLLAPEYELLQQGAEANGYAIQITAYYDHAYLDSLPVLERPQYMLGYGTLPALVTGLRAMLHQPPPGRTDVTLDGSGDMRGNSVEKSRGEAWKSAAPLLRPVTPQARAYLEDFARSAARTGAKVIAIPPALIRTPGYTAPAFRNFLNDLPGLYAKTGITPLGVADIGFLAPRDMYDSAYHANDRGRALYTERILDLLCKTMTCAS